MPVYLFYGFLYIAVDLTSKKKKEDKGRDKDLERRVVHVKYLLEKYGQRWLEKVRKGTLKTFEYI